MPPRGPGGLGLVTSAWALMRYPRKAFITLPVVNAGRVEPDSRCDGQRDIKTLLIGVQSHGTAWRKARESGDRMSSMTLQLCLTVLVCYMGCWREAESYPSRECEHGIPLTKVPDYQNDVRNMEWQDQNEEEVQKVFKRFLFHYTKGHNSGATVHHESHSVHPLLRLSPKLSQRSKKQLLLLKIRTLPEGTLSNREAWRTSSSQLHLLA